MILKKDDIEDIFPMSDVSKGMIYHTLKDTSSYMFHEQSLHMIPIEGFNLKVFERSMDLMVQKHLNLRSVFNMFEYDEPLQIVLRDVKKDIAYIDITNQTPDQQKEFLEKWLEKDRSNPFNVNKPCVLWKVRIFHLSSNKICFAWITHHAIMDGWSTASIITEINNTYVSLLRSDIYAPVPLKSCYKDFVVDQISEKNNPENHAFWKKDLMEYKRYALPFSKVTRESLYNSKFVKKKYDLGIPLQKQLEKVAVEYNTTLKNLCFAAYLYTFYFFSGEKDILVGLLTNSRPPKEDADKIIGCFLNTLPFRFDFQRNFTWREFSSQINDKLNEYLKYGRLPFSEIVKLMDNKEEHQNPLFDVLFNFTDFYVFNDLISTQKVEVEQKESVLQSGIDELKGVDKDNILITFLLSIKNGFSCRLLYYDAVLNNSQADRIMDVFMKVLQKIAYRGEQIASKRSLMDETELLISNSQKRDYPLELKVTDLTNITAERVSERPAVVLQGKSISFGHLEEESNGLAGYLQDQGVKPGTRVGIYLERSIETVVAMLAIAKAGGVYVPISTKLPVARVNYIINDSGCDYIVTENDNKFSTRDSVKFLDCFSRSHTFTPVSGSSSDLLYVIYTSGSTGNPKGVMITHRNVVNLIYGLDEIIYSRYGENLQLALVSPFDFDASVQHLYAALMLGHTLHIVPEEIRADGNALVKFYNKEGIDISDGTPTHVNLIVQTGKRLSTNLKHFLIAGEALSKQLVLAFSQLYEAKITNLYGPTETCVDSTYFHIDSATLSNFDTIPIGKPLPNENIYVLNAIAEEQGIGVVGEIVIGGEGVSKGYNNRPDLTNNSFVEYPKGSNQMVYKTGDKGRWLENGNIEYLGRMDDQIKLRGYRIELGEVKNTILKHPNIENAVVQLSAENNEQFLSAFFTEREAVDIEGLREYLKDSLPVYMLPSRIIKVDSWPLTSAGKIDLQKLKTLKNTLQKELPVAAPETEKEAEVLKIWNEILKNNRIGLNDDFFSIGGDSIKLIKLLYTIKIHFNVQLGVQDFYGNSTVKKLAFLIDCSGNEEAAGVTEAIEELEDFKSDFINQL